MSFRIDVISNRGRSPQTLLRQSWREGKRVRHKTVANLTRMPPHVVDGIRAVLKGGVAFERIGDAFSIRRALPHGHVAAALALARKLGLPRILDRGGSRHADLALAAVIARLVDPASKLATARQLSPETASSSLGALLGLGPVGGNEMLAMLDWLRGRQPRTETALANRHLHDGTLILYDVSSSWMEGRRCPLAAFGHSRDRKAGKKQIAYGLLCSADGCPIAVEVFAGNTADPTTVARQVDKIRKRFGIARVALVGDRGMLTTARIRGDLVPAGLDWISALRSHDIRKLLAPRKGEPVLRPEEAVDDAVAEVASPDFPGERLMVCFNPRLRDERARKREALLAATEAVLREIADSAARARPGSANRNRIHTALGARANNWKVRRHFAFKVRDDALAWARDHAAIEAEARLDGFWVVRTGLAPDDISAERAVEACKSLARVERAFRGLKTTRIEVRPVYVYTEEHVRAHVFLCMLAWHLEWHMRRALAPLLFEDDDRDGARRASPVEPARVSDAARAKAGRKTTPDGAPVHSMATLLGDLATLTLNEVVPPGQPDNPFLMTAEPTALQARALDLLGMRPGDVVYSKPTV